MAVCAARRGLETWPQPDVDEKLRRTERWRGILLIYLYAADLKSLRADLLTAGLCVGEIAYPEYLPNGEFRVEDPDGYTLMIAQSAPDTP
ncbi:MAG: hypothetical protein ABIS06_09885 [Vicinamibacterales bacterium]